MYYVKELHTRFEGYECCIDASVARTAAHEDLKVLFAALAKNAGAIAVALEPRGWDEGGAYDKHKRPDIEWINAATRRFTITDVTIVPGSESRGRASAVVVAGRRLDGHTVKATELLDDRRLEPSQPSYRTVLGRRTERSSPETHRQMLDAKLKMQTHCYTLRRQK